MELSGPVGEEFHFEFIFRFPNRSWRIFAKFTLELRAWLRRYLTLFRPKPPNSNTNTGVVARVGLGRAWVAFHLGSVGIPSNQLQFKIKIELSLEACPRWCASSLPLRRRSVVREGDPLGNRIRRNFDRSRGKSCGNRWVKLIFFFARLKRTLTYYPSRRRCLNSFSAARLLGSRRVG